MGMIGTFDAFTTARLGVYAAQKGLSVVGNNISNLNTDRYTRQVVDQVSFKAGANDKYRSMMDNHVGSGALVTGISQIRDPYLDIRYRNTNADVGYTDTKLGGLQYIKAVLDEVGKGEDAASNEEGDGLLYAQLRDIFKSLEQLSLSPTKENDDLVRTSANSLVHLLNTYADKLSGLHEEVETSFAQDINEVNDILNNIRDLNKSIRTAEINGDKALELRDERNRQIDSLSEYMHIKVEYTMEDIGGGIEVEKLTISLADANPDPNITTDSSILVDGLFATQLSVPKTMPLVNPDFGSTDPAKAGLKDFLYLMADGTGTNKAEEAQQVANNTYNIQLGKLLNSIGEEWKGVTTQPPERVEGIPDYDHARYSVALKAGTVKWKDGDEFKISGKDFKVVNTVTDAATEISVDEANDLTKLAAFIAKNLESDEYTVEAKGTNIVFTAKGNGRVGIDVDQGAPTARPELQLEAMGNRLSKGNMICTNSGYHTKAPADDSTIDNPDGTQTVTRYVQSGSQWYKIVSTVRPTTEVTLDHNDLHGSLQAMRELLTGKGEFATEGNNLTDADGNPINSDMTLDEGAAKTRGIPYYQMSLDLLARQIATQYNSLNQGFMVNQNGNYIDKTGKELTMADGSTVSKTNGLTTDQKNALIAAGIVDANGEPDLNTWLENAGAYRPEGAGNLFSNDNDGDDASNITAANISVSHSWYVGDVKIVPSHVQLFGEDGKPLTNSTEADNVNHMLSLNDQALLYNPKDLDPNAVGSKLFVGSFNDMFSSMNTILGEDQRTLNVQLNTHYASLTDIDTSRDSISGVDLNDETMNMMMYQKAFSAACRVMTVIDSVLEQLINNTAI